MGSEFVKKKVKPYPILATLDRGGQKITVDIHKVARIGFICDLRGHIVKVKETFQVAFEIPVLGRHVFAEAFVVKTYDRALSVGQPPAIQRLAEFHFVSLSSEQANGIEAFIRSIKQKSSDRL